MTFSTSDTADFQEASGLISAASSAGSVAVMTPARSVRTPPNGEPVIRQRLRLGTMLVERRTFPRQQPVSTRINPKSVLLVAPTKGRVEIVAPGGTLTVGSGDVALLARPNETVLVWAAGAHGSVVHLQRGRFQICANRHFGEPRRLAAVDRVMHGDASLADALNALTERDATASSAAAPQYLDEEERLHRALIAAAEREGMANEIFADVRSVREAVAHIRAHHQADCSLAALAAITGVTERTLRERFRHCFGLSITTFVQEVRLDWAHERLSSARESRSIGNLARAAGFATAGTFSKSYQRRFGEPATQTRANAVRDMATA